MLCGTGSNLSTAKMDRAAMRQELGIDANAFVACMQANITACKRSCDIDQGVCLVVDAISSAQARPKLLLAGRLDDRYGVLTQLRDGLGLTEDVVFLGPVRDIASLLGAADLGVHSSWLEGCPNGVLECMASGLAVVGTDIAGIREAVGPEGSALLAPESRNVEAFAQRIITQMRDPDQRQRNGRSNRTRIAELFNPEMTVPGRWRIYQRRIDEKLTARTLVMQPTAQATPEI